MSSLIYREEDVRIVRVHEDEFVVETLSQDAMGKPRWDLQFSYTRTQDPRMDLIIDSLLRLRDLICQIKSMKNSTPVSEQMDRLINNSAEVCGDYRR